MLNIRRQVEMVESKKDAPSFSPLSSESFVSVKENSVRKKSLL